MTRISARHLMVLLMLVSLVVWFVGCASKPPKEERAAAEQAFKTAQVAEKCAALTYTAAENALLKARRLTTEKKYDEARHYFVVAKELAEKARREAAANEECMNPKPVSAGAPAESTESEDEPVLTGTNNPDFELKPIFFPFNSDEITEEAKATLADISAWMNRFPDVSVAVEGHCDDRGSTEYNLALGERRANAVRKVLILLNVNPDKLDIVSYGEERPLVDAENEEAWSRNRRAEFKKRWNR